jgi:hypothetical protein
MIVELYVDGQQLPQDITLSSPIVLAWPRAGSTGKDGHKRVRRGKEENLHTVTLAQPDGADQTLAKLSKKAGGFQLRVVSKEEVHDDQGAVTQKQIVERVYKNLVPVERSVDPTGGQQHLTSETYTPVEEKYEP